MAFEVIEITKEKYSQYIEQILRLRKTIISDMINNGLIDSENEILENDCFNFIESDNSVFLAIADEKGEIKAISIINKGQASGKWNINSCMTDKDIRGNGLARILIFEGLRREMTAFFENPDNKELKLISSFSKDNISIQSVMDFFEFSQINDLNESECLDQLTVKNSNKDDYLKRIEERIAVIYGYNPRKIGISNKRKIDILEEKADYDMINTRKHKADIITRKLAGENMTSRLEQYLLQRIRSRMKNIFDLQKRINKLKNEKYKER